MTPSTQNPLDLLPHLNAVIDDISRAIGAIEGQISYEEHLQMPEYSIQELAQAQVKLLETNKVLRWYAKNLRAAQTGQLRMEPE